MEKFYIAIVGHIDHGKSTLIGRILYDTKSLPEGRMQEIASISKGLGRELEFAYLTDVFLEERKKAMTIDTTQVVFKAPRREYIVIDTPGHKELLKNMVTGASYAEAAMLVVSAKDGIQEQTKRHAYILKLFGVGQIIIIINKMDEASYSRQVFDSLRAELNSLFTQFGIKAAGIIPVSAKCGDNVVFLSKNMPWYHGKTVIGAIGSLKKSAVQHHFRMPVQDVYRFNGNDIVVGRVSSGKIRRNEKVFILPSKKESRLISIKVFEARKEKAAAGESVGLILKTGRALKRGDILSARPFPKVARRFSAVVLCLKGRLLKDSAYTLECATQQSACRIAKITDHLDMATLKDIRGDFINKSEIGKVSIAADSELVYEEFDKLQELGRFLLRKGSNVIAAGVIL